MQFLRIILLIPSKRNTAIIQPNYTYCHGGFEDIFELHRQLKYTELHTSPVTVSTIIVLYIAEEIFCQSNNWNVTAASEFTSLHISVSKYDTFGICLTTKKL